MLKKIELTLEKLYMTFQKQNVITRINIVTEINALIYFQITGPVRAVYEIANLPQAIEAIQTSLRNVIGEMDLMTHFHLEIQLTQSFKRF